MSYKISKSDDEWKKILTPEQFDVCRKKGTERAFTGVYCNTKDNGTYNCSCCNAKLFSSETKFDSGTGWPSFFKPIDDENIEYIENLHRKHTILRKHRTHRRRHRRKTRKRNRRNL